MSRLDRHKKIQQETVHKFRPSAPLAMQTDEMSASEIKEANPSFFEKAIVGMVKPKARQTIQRLIKEERLEFMGENQLAFTDRKGERKIMDYLDFAIILVTPMNGTVDPNMMIPLITEEYHKTRGYNGGLKK